MYMYKHGAPHCTKHTCMVRGGTQQPHHTPCARFAKTKLKENKPRATARKKKQKKNAIKKRGSGAGGVTYVGDELARLHGDGLAGGRVDDGRHGGLGAVRYRRSLGRRL